MRSSIVIFKSMSSPRVAGIFSLLICVLQLAHAAEERSAPMPPLSEASPIRIVDGPILLHGNVTGEWGGHTFSYIMTGENYVFWAGMLYEPGRTSRTMLVGQYPKKAVD